MDRSCLERALNEMVCRHEPLRTLYPSQRGRPIQVIQPFVAFSLPYLDFSEMAEDDRQPAVLKYASEHGLKPFNLQQEPLIRAALLHTAHNEDYLFFCTHHIGLDGWSRQVFFNELMQIYDALRSGKEPSLPDLPIQFLDFALWQREWLSGETLDGYLAHWKNILSGELPILDLPADHPRPAMQTYQGARHYFEIQPAIVARMTDLCQKEHLTPFHIFLAAYAILLMRYSGQDDIITGCPFANRPFSKLDGIIGNFINTLPIRINLRDDPSVRTLLKQVRDVMLDALSFQAIPFEKLVMELGQQRDLSRTPIYQVLINMRNLPERKRDIKGVHIDDILMEDTTAAFDISLELGKEGDHFLAAIRYNTKLFDETTILHMASHYQNILSAILENQERPIFELEILTPSERQRQLLDWNDTSAKVPLVCVHELISQQAMKNPDIPAVICNGRQMTYSTLERKSNQLAKCLLARGVHPGKLVGILLPRSEELLIAQLAIIKIGCTYFSIDLTYPVDRLLYMLQDAKPEIVITHSSLESQIPNEVQRICLDTHSEEIQVFPEHINFAGTDQDLPLYVTYTSGSTGHPKGVVNNQKGTLNYLNYLVQTFHLGPGDRVIQFSSLSYDVAFRDTLGTLTFGGTVVLMDDSQMRDPDFIIRAIVDQQITCILSIVPTMLRALSFSSSRNSLSENHLRLVMPSGEALLPADIEPIKKAWGESVQLVNQYGPSECSMIATMYKVPERLPEDIQVVPIGKPIWNVRTYVLDNHFRPVPVGVKGELFIGGIGVGLGYLNQPTLTTERFLPDPFFPGGRMYRSGDIVRQLPDGTICYLGRFDHQIKIRGYRVELGEIEAAMTEYQGVRDAAVVLVQKDNSETLSAYITVAEGDREELKMNLHTYLTERLPFYMLPSTITVLDKMPLTSNRKIDRRALPSSGSIMTKEHYLAPRNDIENRLVSIWKEVLGVEQIGVKDNFFELGGHSLLAVRLFARIQEEFHQNLPLFLLFKDSTVEALANSLANAGSPLTPFDSL